MGAWSPVANALFTHGHYLGLTPTDKLVIIALERYRWERGAWVYPSRDTLADDTGLGTATIGRSIAGMDSGANPKAIQEFMGHKKITTTYDIYGHLLPGAHDEVRRRMDAYLEADDALTGAPPGAQPDLAESLIVTTEAQTA